MCLGDPVLPSSRPPSTRTTNLRRTEGCLFSKRVPKVRWKVVGPPYKSSSDTRRSVSPVRHLSTRCTLTLPLPDRSRTLDSTSSSISCPTFPQRVRCVFFSAHVSRTPTSLVGSYFPSYTGLTPVSTLPSTLLPVCLRSISHVLSSPEDPP